MRISSEELVQTIFQKCAGTSGCEVCRPHMEDDCLFFPELYRLQDKFIDKGKPLTSKSVNKLIDLCTLCGLCPCPDVRMLILKTKATLADERGLPFSSRCLADAQRAGRLGCLFSNTANFINRSKVTSPCLKKAFKVHTDRKLPGFPKQSFFSWARKKGLHVQNRHSTDARQKVVYFTGCSAGYFFPEVGKSTVNLLENIGVEVFVPEQDCCSMPLLMEGQKQKAMEKIQKNVSMLVQVILDGYKLVCSCPTCGYFFRKLLLENAYFSDAAQEKMKPKNNIMKVPLGSGSGRFISLPKNIYRKILKDDGYFSSINPLDRIKLAESVMDLGEYLLPYHSGHNSFFSLNDSQSPLMYFAPCHQREQEIGQPYFEILSSISGTDVVQIGGALDCCGMGGHLGYKASFHRSTLIIGRSLFEKFKHEEHRTIITDCLSCRMQFQHEFSNKIYHPVQIIQTSSDYD